MTMPHKVALVCNRITGGAGIACVRLHRGLLKIGHSSSLLVRTGESDERNTSLLPNLRYRPGYLEKGLLKLGYKYVAWKFQLELSKFNFFRPQGLETTSLPLSIFDLTKSKTICNGDIINLHWVAGMINWPTFFRKIDKPVVWTLHDENPFSGLQHYDEVYLGMDANGYPIKRQKSSHEIEIENYWIEKKVKWVEGFKNLSIISPSKWLIERSKDSPVFGSFPHYHIPYGLEADVFRKLDRETCRAILGLPQGKFLLLFVAEDLSNRRKGFEYLMKALTLLPNSLQNKLCLVSVGRYILQETNMNIIPLGPIRDERLMAMVYNAADAFVIPSLVDNLPNTMLESLMCGTPVVGFPSGGITESVSDGIHGFLAESISAVHLSKAIERAMVSNMLINETALANNCARKYGFEIQAKRYSELFFHLN